MAERTIITDVGREQIARFLTNYPSWVGDGYELFSYTRWGEGGWKTVNGVDVPRDPQAVNDDNEAIDEFTDLDVIERPSEYGTFTFSSVYYEVNLTTEVDYIGGAEERFQVTFKLESTETNDDGSGSSPRLFEVGMYDNAGDVGAVPDGDSTGDGQGVSNNNLILYATFDGFNKTNNKTVEMTAQIPFDP